PDAIEAGRRLAADGIGVTVVDPRWLLPLSLDLVEMAAGYDAVISVEDGIVHGGFGWALRDGLTQAATPVRCLGVPQIFPEHGERAQMIADFGYDADGIERAARDAVSALGARDS
ncbi:transketolase C-terminal domain-containing protein, partial [Actinomyces sp. ICM58]|uniref:transketolase C-terminal domain-containing protein n=2 Tax=unclassified Actinomyces TaxID=2609248 RepID=UPI000587398E